MVKLAYKGINKILIGGYQIGNGETEIADADFYKLMSYKSFASRVKSGVFKVPKGFPLVKPVDVVDESVAPEAEDHEEEHATGPRMGQKAALREISKSEDLEELKKLSEDDRPRVAEAAKRRLSNLTNEE